MKCFGAKGQVSCSLFADGTAARSLHQAGDHTMGFPRAPRLCPASNEHLNYRTHPDCQYLLPLP